MNKERNLDGTKNTSSGKRYSSKRKAKKIIRTRKIKSMTYVGIDLHKEFLQVEAMDDNGSVLFNERIQNTRNDIRKAFSIIPKNSKYVIESSSVWYGVFRFMRDELHLDVVLSNPYHTKAIAASKKKTDKIDAHILVDLLRGRYISSCHVDGYLKMIVFLNDRIAEADIRIKDVTKHDSNAQLLESVPGIGRFTALVISSEIDKIDRFPDSHKLCAYAGIVPSVRNSADTIHHGKITRRGSDMLRWVLVEAVHSHVRFANNSVITKFYKRLAKKRGTSKAAVAAASKLLRIIYWMLKYKMTFDQCLKNAK